MPEQRAFLQPGTIIAGYTITRMLGSGGMGQVYLAQHPRLPRHDALKVLYPHLGSDESFRARFQREATLAAQLSHPNIVPVYDAGEDKGVLWLSMQFIDGTDASRLINLHPQGLDPALAVDIITQAGRGLDRAHSRGMLHRDIKPANLLLTGDWERDDPDSHQVLVSDFGIARTLANTSNLTSTGSILATISYAAPEILQAKTVDHRADIYALGCTLHQLLTGSMPFPRPDTAAVMLAHLTEPPPQPAALRPGLPEALNQVIATAMAKNPDDRYPSCRALSAAALAAINGTPLVPPPPVFPQVQPNSDATVMGQLPPLPTGAPYTQANPSVPPPPPPHASAQPSSPQPSTPPPNYGGGYQAAAASAAPRPPARPQQPAKSSARNPVLIALAGVLVFAAVATGAWYVIDSGRSGSSGDGSLAATDTFTDSESTEETTTEDALPADEQCTDAIKSSTRWVCLTSAYFQDGNLIIEYDADFAGVTPDINGSYHLHVWGSDGEYPDADSMGTQASPPGTWLVKDDQPVLMTAEEAATYVGDNPKVCARIANGNHALEPDAEGGYTTGNCVTITR